MSTHEGAMKSQPRSMGAGMADPSATEMNPEQPDLHTLDLEEQRKRMGLAGPQTAMGQPPGEGMPSPDEIARREKAAKLGHHP
jgi:hypothetical protein